MSKAGKSRGPISNLYLSVTAEKDENGTLND